MSRQVRRISVAEWERWCADASNLPIACDPYWAQSLRVLPSYKGEAIPFLVDDESDEAIVVMYPRNQQPLDSATLSPLGLPAAFHTKSSGFRNLALLGIFLREQALRWRSIGFTRGPYWGANAPGLASADLTHDESTHVLELAGDYNTLFSNDFKGATRTCIRRAESEGVVVERATDPDMVRRYYRIHSKLAEEKGGYAELYPESLFVSLAERCQRFELLVARKGDDVIGGAAFLDDGPTTFYWHAAADRTFSRMQPAYAILDSAIKLALERRKAGVNLGASAGIDSLILFKESWGARPVAIRSEVHRNPLIRGLRSIGSRVRAIRGSVFTQLGG
ncbi:MAG: GNAT family N-acetyltransferase [Gemmatimonadales bacterium]